MPSLEGKDLKEIRFSQKNWPKNPPGKRNIRCKGLKVRVPRRFENSKVDSSEQAEQNISTEGRQVTSKSDTDSVKIWGFILE